MQFQGRFHRLAEAFHGDIVFPFCAVGACAVASVKCPIGIENKRGKRLVCVELEHGQVHSVRPDNPYSNEGLQQLL